MRAILASRPPNRPVAGPLDSALSRRSSCAEAELKVPSRLTEGAPKPAAPLPVASSSEESESDESEPSCGKQAGENGLYCMC